MKEDQYKKLVDKMIDKIDNEANSIGAEIRMLRRLQDFLDQTRESFEEGRDELEESDLVN